MGTLILNGGLAWPYLSFGSVGALSEPFLSEKMLFHILSVIASEIGFQAWFIEQPNRALFVLTFELVQYSCYNGHRALAQTSVRSKSGQVGVSLLTLQAFSN